MQTTKRVAVMLRNRMRLISIQLFSIILQADHSITSYFMIADKLMLIASFLEKNKKITSLTQSSLNRNGARSRSPEEAAALL